MFTTAPTGRVPFRFTAFGDEGVTYDSVATTNQIRGLNPAFHLHAGDISYAEDGGDGLLTDSYDPRVWDSWFAQSAPAAGSIPWQVAVGNHEMESWYPQNGYAGQHARWDFPGGTSGPVYYSFTYSNVAVLSLDANDVSYEIPANFGYTDGAQTAWVKKTLAAYRADPSIDFIVAYFHHCAYSTCTSHGSEGGVREFFVPLFDEYNVDLVINGHNHIYERNNPLIGGTQTSTAPIGSTRPSPPHQARRSPRRLRAPPTWWPAARARACTPSMPPTATRATSTTTGRSPATSTRRAARSTRPSPGRRSGTPGTTCW
jgi:hypothetical protein